VGIGGVTVDNKLRVARPLALAASASDERVEALVGEAHARGAPMVVSSYFCAPGSYWVDVIAPGYATVARGDSPYEAAASAFQRFLQATRQPSRKLPERKGR
jgi:hypothetical protein